MYGIEVARTTIINSGILVKGGDVKAEVVAVGEGATAKKATEIGVTGQS